MSSSVCLLTPLLKVTTPMNTLSYRVSHILGTPKAVTDVGTEKVALSLFLKHPD